MRRKTLPPRSSENQMPESHAETFVSKAPHIPPTAFSGNSVPHSIPSARFTSAMGTLTAVQARMRHDTGRPSGMAASRHTSVCASAMGSMGSR